MARTKPAARDAKRVYLPSSLLSQSLRHVLRRRGLWRVAGAVLLIAVGLAGMVTAVGWNAGGLVFAVGELLRRAFGLGAVLLCLVLIATGGRLLWRPPARFGAQQWIQIIAGELAFLALLALMHSLSFGLDAFILARDGGGGGAVGWVLSRLVFGALGSEGGLARLAAVVMWGALLLISAVVALRPLLVREVPPAHLPDQLSDARLAAHRTAAEGRTEDTPRSLPVKLVDPSLTQTP
ncbi:MAG: hypothetical protein RMN25_14260, partial [Anaerolineae bacterium]|nr:hypothetical protein [Thermoflexales bacterium]MDW8408933.1 hypothetical protein [Anaerolineae bacterium]